MKRVILICLGFIIYCSFAFAADIVKGFKIPTGKKLEMELKTRGSINIVGWDRKVVAVEVDLKGQDADDCKVEFDVWAKTMGGDIRIDAIDGWVCAETMGGDVEVTMVGDPANGQRDVDISSKSGDITVTVPEGLSMDVHITLAQT